MDTGMSYLIADYSIECDEERAYGSHSTYATVMIAVYPVGVPLLLSWLLWRKRAKIKQPVEEREKDEEVRKPG